MVSSMYGSKVRLTFIWNFLFAFDNRIHSVSYDAHLWYALQHIFRVETWIWTKGDVSMLSTFLQINDMKKKGWYARPQIKTLQEKLLIFRTQKYRYLLPRIPLKESKAKILNSDLKTVQGQGGKFKDGRLQMRLEKERIKPQEKHIKEDRELWRRMTHTQEIMDYDEIFTCLCLYKYLFWWIIRIIIWFIQ